MKRFTRQSGFTLMEVMMAVAILAGMMMLAYRTVAGTTDSRKVFEKFEAHNHELRMAMGRMVADLEGAYLSKNEDQMATHPRTLFVAKSSNKLPEIKFSSLAHKPLWADANESEQTVISYISRNDPEHAGVIDWVRREQRRPSNEVPEQEPADYDVLVHDIVSAKVEFFNWKNTEWQDTWDTTQSDGQKGWLPSRVRITVVVKDAAGNDYKITTQARILMQEALYFGQQSQ
jgi:type II secretion system protein J